jgi:O-antigen ligase
VSASIPVMAWGVLLASIVVLPLAVRTLWMSGVVRHEWTSTSSLIFLAGMVGGLPTALSNLVAPRQERLDAFGNVRVGLTGWPAQVHQLLIIFTFVAALLFFILRIHREPVAGRSWAAILLVAIYASSDLINGGVADLGPRFVTLLVLMLAISVAQPGRPAFLGVAAVCLTYAFLSGLQAGLHPTYAFRTCRTDKCGPGGALYSGAFSNENLLGLVLALSLPFVWLALRGRIRIIVVGYVFATVLLTGSRTALLAVTAALVALVVLRPSLDRSDYGATGHIRQIAAIVGVAVIAILGAVLPLLSSATSALGDRTYFWRVALDGIRTSPLIGNGGTAWPNLYQSGQIPVSASYSPHNQWLDVLYASGFLGLVVFVSLLVYLLLRDRLLITASATILIPVLAASTLERPWSFAINDGLTFILLATLLATGTPTTPNKWDAELPASLEASAITKEKSHS